MLIRDLGSIQIADWDDDEGSEDSEESEFSEDSGVSEPIGEEDIEYIASVAERSGDVYQTIVESLEILMRDLDSNQMYPHSEDDEYSSVGCVHEFGKSVLSFCCLSRNSPFSMLGSVFPLACPLVFSSFFFFLSRVF